MCSIDTSALRAGVVDCVAGSGSVELRQYPLEHPFAQLQGSDNIIAFTTQRYKSQPLIVRCAHPCLCIKTPTKPLPPGSLLALMPDTPLGWGLHMRPAEAVLEVGGHLTEHE
jgi:hypothetical protein